MSNRSTIEEHRRPTPYVGPSIPSSLYFAAEMVLSLGGKVLIVGPSGGCGADILAHELAFNQVDPDTVAVIDAGAGVPVFPDEGRAIALGYLGNDEDFDTLNRPDRGRHLVERADLIIRITQDAWGVGRQASLLTRS